MVPLRVQRGRSSSSLFSSFALALAALAALASLAGCKGEGEGGVAPFILDTSGGDGAGVDGEGGRGGLFMAYLVEGSSEGGIIVLEDGRVGASFEPSRQPAPDFGPNGFVVDDDLLVGSFLVGEPAIGTLYYSRADDALYVSNGNGVHGDEAPVSGLHVTETGRLVLPHHTLDEDATVVAIDLTHDVVNDGVITTAIFAGQDRGNLRIETTGGRYMGSGDIESQGLELGQGGGDITIIAVGDSFNDGEWLASGFGAAAAGGAVEVSAEPLARFENTGRVDVRGGAALDIDGIGSPGGSVTFTAGLDLFNAGEIDASGGDGSGDGGAGGEIALRSTAGGELRNSGRLRADGGEGGDPLGSGGDGGSLSVFARGGAIRSSARLSAAGGDAGFAGRGGIVRFTSSADADPDALSGAGNLSVSGSIDVGGGDGRVGGPGGQIDAQITQESGPFSPETYITLRGYRRIDASGGDGASIGGEGGSVFIHTDALFLVPFLPVVVDTPATAAGGDADPSVAGGVGGDGGRETIGAGTLDQSAPTDVGGGTGETPGEDGERLITIQNP